MDTRVRILLSMLVLLAIASCVSAPPPPAPPERRMAPPPVLALPAPAPLASDWRDWPQTPGEWRYLSDLHHTTALFGQDGSALALICFRGNSEMQIALPGRGAGPITVRTTSITRALPSKATDYAEPAAVAHIAANDPLLDAIAFSRGRFVLEQAGQPALVLPAWAEVERVIEDCRK